MKRYLIHSLLALFMGGVCGAVSVQDNQEKLHHRAIECLASKQFLPPTTKAESLYGFLLDQKSYPGKAMLYVVAYAAPRSRNGHVFTIFVGDDNDPNMLNIQNNARFVLGGDGYVSFPDPPLGGTWTQEHLMSAIKQIEKQPRVSITHPGTETKSIEHCEAYTDPQPERK